MGDEDEEKKHSKEEAAQPARIGGGLQTPGPRERLRSSCPACPSRETWSTRGGSPGSVSAPPAPRTADFNLPSCQGTWALLGFPELAHQSQREVGRSRSTRRAGVSAPL